MAATPKISVNYPADNIEAPFCQAMKLNPVISRREFLKAAALGTVLTLYNSFGRKVRRAEALEDPNGDIAWYEDGFENVHIYGEHVLITPNTILFIPARINLRATIEAEKVIELHKHTLSDKCEREVPAIFWKENITFQDGKATIFETKYCSDPDNILPISFLEQIPEGLRDEFLEKAPNGIYELANELVGDEKDTRKLLMKFYTFASENIKYEKPTTGKPIEELLDEYKNTGYFFGNCKEARDFYMALCNAKGYPAKRVSGKAALGSGGHVWADVFVPTEDGYKLLPADPARGSFATLNPSCHLFFERAPLMHISDSDNCTGYWLNIERAI